MLPTLLLAIYLGGTLWSLVVMYEPFPARLLWAPLWPIGPLALVLVVSLLVCTALVIWPFFGLLAVASAIVLWLVLGA